MGLDYALVHLKYTIPPAILLTLIYRPFLTRLDVYKILFLITIAVVATTPWDSYLIKTKIWSYSSDVIIGPTLFEIPLEELFFFVIQTYNTTLLYLLLNKPIFHPVYLRHEKKSDPWKYAKLAGQLVGALAIKKALGMIKEEGTGVYLGMILVWAVPFLVLLWSLAYQFMIGLPMTSTLAPILLPTVYLWIVDTFALQRGTWVIESGTKLGKHLWPHLEIEEAVFFLLTNTLIVFGLIAFDNAMAIINTFPYFFSIAPGMPSPVILVRALLIPAAAYDADRINGLSQAVERLKSKSRSFYLASGAFEGDLRIDLITLYSFCRVADDLIDNAKTPTEARQWIKRLTTFLDYSYRSNDPMARDPNNGIIARYVVQNFPRNTHSALLQLPTERLSAAPLYHLLKGFEIDLQFEETKDKDNTPIKTEQDLDAYGAGVAGTVAELCIELILHHYPNHVSKDQRKSLLSAGGRAGIALQYTNIARDLATDAAMGRIYIPASYLKKEKLSPQQALEFLAEGKTSKTSDESDMQDKMERVRGRLLERAFALYEDARPAIEMLPVGARAPMRVAVESYMEIGRVLKTKGYAVKKGRATVPLSRRILVAWRAASRG